MTIEQQEREAARLDYETLMADARDRLGHQVSLAQGLLRSLTLINGGAIVALFTLIGNHGDGLALDPGMLKRAFAFFIAGLVLSIVSAFGGFLSQVAFAFCSTLQAWDKQDEMLGATPQGRDHITPFRRGDWFLSGAIATALLSLLCFSAGSWAALAGLLDGSTTIVNPG